MAEKRPSDRKNAVVTLRLTRGERAWATLLLPPSATDSPSSAGQEVRAAMLEAAEWIANQTGSAQDGLSDKGNPERMAIVVRLRRLALSAGETPHA